MTNVVFRPTKEEFSNFQKYIEHIESQGSAEVGLIKVRVLFITTWLCISTKKTMLDISIVRVLL